MKIKKITMRHRVKKIKIKYGKDANKMLVKKLVFNFISHGKMITTLKRAKILKSQIEKIVGRAKEETAANKNYFLRYFGNKKLFDFLFGTIGPTFKDIVGGYVKIVRIGQRDSDGSVIGRVEWTRPIVYKENKNDKKI